MGSTVVPWTDLCCIFHGAAWAMELHSWGHWQWKANGHSSGRVVNTEMPSAHTWHVVGPQFSSVMFDCLWPHLMGHPFWPIQGSCLSPTVPSLLPSAALAAPASLSSLDIYRTCLPVFFPVLSIPTLPLIEMHHNDFFCNTVPLWYSMFNVIDNMLFLAQNHLRGLFKNSDQQLWVVEERQPGQCNVNNRVEL